MRGGVEFEPLNVVDFYSCGDLRSFRLCLEPFCFEEGFFCGCGMVSGDGAWRIERVRTAVFMLN